MLDNSPHCLRIIGGDMAVTSLRLGTVATYRNQISAAIAKGCGQCCFTDLPLVPGRCSSWGTMLALQMVTIWVVSTIKKLNTWPSEGKMAGKRLVQAISHFSIFLSRATGYFNKDQKGITGPQPLELMILSLLKVPQILSQLWRK